MVRMTEMEKEYLAHLPYLHQDSTDPGANSQLDAHLVVHDYRIVQRVTDGHKVVIGHHNQEETFSGSQYKEEAHLSGTGQHSNASILGSNVD